MGSPSQLVVCSSSADHNLRRKNNMSNHLISCLFASAARYLRLKLGKKKQTAVTFFAFLHHTHKAPVFVVWVIYSIQFQQKMDVGICLSLSSEILGGGGGIRKAR